MGSHFRLHYTTKVLLIMILSMLCFQNVLSTQNNEKNVNNSQETNKEKNEYDVNRLMGLSENKQEIQEEEKYLAKKSEKQDEEENNSKLSSMSMASLSTKHSLNNADASSDDGLSDDASSDDAMKNELLLNDSLEDSYDVQKVNSSSKNNTKGVIITIIRNIMFIVISFRLSYFIPFLLQLFIYHYFSIWLETIFATKNVSIIIILKVVSVVSGMYASFFIPLILQMHDYVTMWFNSFNKTPQIDIIKKQTEPEKDSFIDDSLPTTKIASEHTATTNTPRNAAERKLSILQKPEESWTKEDCIDWLWNIEEEKNKKYRHRFIDTGMNIQKFSGLAEEAHNILKKLDVPVSDNINSDNFDLEWQMKQEIHLLKTACNLSGFFTRDEKGIMRVEYTDIQKDFTTGLKPGEIKDDTLREFMYDLYQWNSKVCFSFEEGGCNGYDANIIINALNSRYKEVFDLIITFVTRKTQEKYPNACGVHLIVKTAFNYFVDSSCKKDNKKFKRMIMTAAKTGKKFPSYPMTITIKCTEVD